MLAAQPAKERKDIKRIAKSLRAFGGEFVLLWAPSGPKETHGFASPGAAEFIHRTQAADTFLALL